MTIIISHKSNSSDEIAQELVSMTANHNEHVENPAATTEDEHVNQQTSWRSVFSFTTREHSLTLSLSFILAGIVGIIKPAITIFTGKLFNDLTDFGAGNTSAADLMQNVSKWCVIITTFGAITWILNWVFFSMWLGFGELQAKSARSELFKGMLKKEMSWYDLQSEGIGALLSRIATQVRDLQISVSQPFGFIIEDVGTVCGALGIAFYNSWKLTLVTLAGFPIAVVVLGLISAQMKASIEAQKRDLTQASKYVHTAITSIDTVKAYNGQEQEVWQYASAIKKAAHSYLKQANSNALQMGITRFVIISMFVQGFWFGISLFEKGLSAGAVLTTFYACLMATEAAELLLLQWLVIARGMSAGATLKALLSQMRNGKAVLAMGGSSTPSTCFGDIEVTNASFAYPSNPHRLALDKTNFFFPAGETTFIIGKSGSGKSTLSSLLLKFYEPSSGDLFVDGESVQTLDATWLRQNITLVEQQSTLFDESISQNIALGSLNSDSATREDVLAACEVPMLREVINDLPEGLNTYLGGGGNSMSGGQKQRVALARARLRDTPILILDEATSALDQISRSLVMDAIREWRKGRTTIIITHDISQVLENDYVYVLEHGKLIQEGYRKNLARKMHGPFASFTPVGPEAPEDTSSDADTGSNARDDLPPLIAKDPNISLAGSFGSDSSDNIYVQPQSNSKRTSALLESQDENPTINNQRASYRMPSAYANVARAEDSIARRNEEAMVLSRQEQSRQQNFSYNDPSWAENFSSYRPLSSTIRALGFRPQSIMFTPSMQNSASFNEETELDLGKLSPGMPSRIEKGMMKRSALASIGTRHHPGAARKSEGINPPVDEVRRIFSPRRFVHQFNRSREGEPEDRKAPGPKKTAASLKEILGTVWPTLMWNEKIILVIGFVFAFIHAAATPVFSYILARLIQVFYDTENRGVEARKWSLAILAIAVVDAVATYFMHYLLEYCGQAWVNTLRVRALQRILNQPRSWFDKEMNNAGRLNECLDRNGEEMRNLVGRFAGYVFVAVSMMAIAIIWSLTISWKLTLVGLSSAPFIWGVTQGFQYTSGKWEGRSNRSAELAHRIFTETFSNIRVVRAFTLEKYFHGKYSTAISKTYKIGVRRSVYAGIFFGIAEASTLFVTALIFYYATVLAAHGALSVTSVFTVISLLIFGINNANAFMGFIPQISQSKVTATQLLYLANLSNHVSHEALGKIRIATPFPIKLNSLCFTYPTRPTVQVLEKVSMTFIPGSCTSIVGSSGSGKSTIASLLLNLYPASPPSLLTGNSTIPPLTFANYPIDTLHTPTVRSHIAIVPQTPILFPTTISHNIAYSLPTTSPFNNEYSIAKAARDADIHDFIQSLPNGYQTLIGDGGMGLSGGQSQRIAIARALIRQPKVLILDEATSALDGESAGMIRATVSRLSKGSIPPPYEYSNINEGIQPWERIGLDDLRTTSRRNPYYSNSNTSRRSGKAVERDMRNDGMAVIIITHSVEMMRIAEKIVVLEHGKVVEVGEFDELVRRRGSFERLVRGVEYRRDLDTVVEATTPTSPVGHW